MTKLAETLEQELGETVKLFRTMCPSMDFALLDIVHPEASKGVGVAAVAAELDISREEVMAIGDNFNDLEMLRYAGTGVVMGNADQVLRELQGIVRSARRERPHAVIDRARAGDFDCRRCNRGRYVRTFGHADGEAQGESAALARQARKNDTVTNAMRILTPM